MRYLTGIEEQEAITYLLQAAKVAEGSPCYRSKCGSVIAKDSEIIGSGFNAPPGGKRLEQCFKDDLPNDFKSDKTCCVHAEQRAIMQALREHPQEILGSRLYFVRLDLENNLLRSGKPYCTICSKMTLDAGIGEFVLWHKEGICVYDTVEYNDLSFKFRL